ncbi:ER membrane protein complex subunit 4 [Dirofilaria immitis]|nr:ER membrane protein complex subunit 4 [Dirofilaria immitis]
MAKSPISLTKWKLDLATAGMRTVSRVVDSSLNPPGYSQAGITVQQIEQTGDSEQTHHLMKKRAWDMALQPIKSLPMNLFMMYMSGSTISIFPIMMIAMMAWRPVKALMNVNLAFKPLQDEHMGSLLLHKLVFVLGNMIAIAMALYKLHSMGLLPNHASDWLDFQLPPQRMQYSFVSDSFIS